MSQGEPKPWERKYNVAEPKPWERNYNVKKKDDPSDPESLITSEDSGEPSGDSVLADLQTKFAQTNDKALKAQYAQLIADEVKKKEPEPEKDTSLWDRANKKVDDWRRGIKRQSIAELNERANQEAVDLGLDPVEYRRLQEERFAKILPENMQTEYALVSELEQAKRNKKRDLQGNQVKQNPELFKIVSEEADNKIKGLESQLKSHIENQRYENAKEVKALMDLKEQAEDDDEKKEIQQQIDAVVLRDKNVFAKPEKVVADLVKDGKIEPPSDPKESIKIVKDYFHSLLKERSEIYQELKSKNIVGGVELGMALDPVFNDSDIAQKARRFKEIESELLTITPIALLNRHPDTQDDDDNFSQKFLNETSKWIQGFKGTPVGSEVAIQVLNQAEELGIAEDLNASRELLSAARWNEEKGRFDGDPLLSLDKAGELGGMLFSLAALMGTAGNAQAGAYRAIRGENLLWNLGKGAAIGENLLWKIGRGSFKSSAYLNLSRTGQILAKSKHLSKAIDFTGKAAVNMFNVGARYEIGGRIFPNAQEELNFGTGMLGSVGRGVAIGMGGIGKNILTKVSPKFEAMFAGGTPRAIKVIGEYGKSLGKLHTAGVGETFEETAQELYQIHKRYNGDFLKGIKEQFGDFSDLGEFAITTYVMGFGMGAGEFGSALRKHAYQNALSRLSEDERKRVEKVVQTLNGEIKTSVEESVETGSKPKKDRTTRLIDDLSEVSFTKEGMKAVEKGVENERKRRAIRVGSRLADVVQDGNIELEFISSAEDMDAILESMGEEKGSRAFRYGNKIVVDVSSMSDNTIFHEFYHPVLDIIKATNEEAYNSIINTAKSFGRTVWKDGKLTQESYEDWAKRLYAEKEEGVQQNEMITEWLADLTTARSNDRTLMEKVREFAMQIADFFGVELSSEIELGSDPRLFLDKLTEAMASGKKVSFKAGQTQKTPVKQDTGENLEPALEPVVEPAAEEKTEVEPVVDEKAKEDYDHWTQELEGAEMDLENAQEEIKSLKQDLANVRKKKFNSKEEKEDAIWEHKDMIESSQYNVTDAKNRIREAKREIKKAEKKLNKGKVQSQKQEVVAEKKGQHQKISPYDPRTDEDIEREKRAEANYRAEIDNKFIVDGNNYIFKHYSRQKKKDLTPRSSGASLITSKEEASAINTVGGITMMYTEENQSESGTGSILHKVKVPKDKVYIFNSDADGLYFEAKALFNERYPNQAFTPNHQIAWITEVANKYGYDAVVAKWIGNSWRAQTRKPLVPFEVKDTNAPVQFQRQEAVEAPVDRVDKTGQQNAEFFTGKAKEASSEIPYKPVLRVNPIESVGRSYKTFTNDGNFTGHISKMIAGFAEKQMMVANSIVQAPFVKKFLDIGTSEGGLVKTVAANRADITAVGVDPNPTMLENYNKTPDVPNAEYRLEALGASWVESDGTVINEFKTEDKFEVINEDFVFQFISSDRSGQLDMVKNFLTDDGVFITSEKFFTSNFEENENKKYDHQSKYFNPDQLTEDKQTIITGMSDDMVNDVDYVLTLLEKFDYVEEFWNAGNFKGYIASNSLENLNTIKDGIGDLSSNFSDKKSLTSGRVFQKDSLVPQFQRNDEDARPRESGDLRVSQRVPTGKKRLASDPHSTSDLAVDMKAAERDMPSYSKNAFYLTKHDLLNGAVSEEDLKTLKKAVESDSYDDAMDASKRVYDSMKDRIKSNLIWLYNQYPPEVIDIAKKWYEGANKLAEEFAYKYGVTKEQAAGVIAALSPQNDWYNNVSIAERILSIHRLQGERFDDKMYEFMEMKLEQNIKDNKKAFAKGKRKTEGASKTMLIAMEIAKRIKGKRLSELNTKEKAVFIRTWDELYNQSEYFNYSPDGTKLGIAKSPVTGKDFSKKWNSWAEISTAISIIEDGSLENISFELGGKHKVRNFYNNIIDPNSSEADVTMDTHAIAAALIKALSGTSPEVSQNFGSSKGNMKVANNSTFGVNAIYAVFADAYRDAAAELDLLPRELQSVTWEAVRGLFTAKFKTNSTNVKAVNGIWSKFKGDNINKIRDDVKRQANGIELPIWWTDRSYTEDVSRGERGADTRELSSDVLYAGRSSGRSSSGDRGADAGRDQVQKQKREDEGRVINRTARRLMNATKPDLQILREEILLNPTKYGFERTAFVDAQKTIDDMSIADRESLLNKGVEWAIRLDPTRNEHVAVLAGVSLLNYYGSEGNQDKVNEVFDQLWKAGHYAGLILRQMAELKGTTKESVVQMVIAQLNKMKINATEEELSKLRELASQWEVASRAHGQKKTELLDLIDSGDISKLTEDQRKQKIDELEELFVAREDLWVQLNRHANSMLPMKLKNLFNQILQGNLLTTASISVNIFANLFYNVLPIRPFQEMVSDVYEWTFRDKKKNYRKFRDGHNFYLTVEGGSFGVDFDTWFKNQDFWNDFDKAAFDKIEGRVGKMSKEQAIESLKKNRFLFSHINGKSVGEWVKSKVGVEAMRGEVLKQEMFFHKANGVNGYPYSFSVMGAFFTGHLSGVSEGVKATFAESAISDYIEEKTGKRVEGKTPAEMNSLEKYDIQRRLQPILAMKQLINDYMTDKPKVLPVNERGKTPAWLIVEKMVEASPVGMNADIMFRLLALGDVPFRYMAETAHARRIAKQKGIRTPEEFKAMMGSLSKSERETIRRAGDAATFADDRALSRIASKGFRYLGSEVDKIKNPYVQTAVGLVIKSVVPFVRIPANLMQAVIELALPVIPMVGVAHYHSKDKRKAGEHLSKVFLSAMMYAAASMLYEAGVLVGDPRDDDDAKRKQWKYNNPNSINVSRFWRFVTGEGTEWREDDVAYEFHKAGIFGMFLAYYINMREGLADESIDPTLINQMTAAPLSGVSSVLSQSFLANAFGVIQSVLDGKGDFISQTGLTFSNIVIPNNYTALMRSRRDKVLTSSDKDPFKRFDKALSLRFMSNPEKGVLTGARIYPVVDDLGLDVDMTPEGQNSFFHHMFSPSRERRFNPITATIKAEQVKIAEAPTKNGRPPDFDVFASQNGKDRLKVIVKDDSFKNYDGIYEPINFNLTEGDKYLRVKIEGSIRRALYSKVMFDEAGEVSKKWDSYSDSAKKEILSELSSKASGVATDIMKAKIYKGIVNGQIEVFQETEKYEWIQEPEHLTRMSQKDWDTLGLDLDKIIDRTKSEIPR